MRRTAPRWAQIRVGIWLTVNKTWIRLYRLRLMKMEPPKGEGKRRKRRRRIETKRSSAQATTIPKRVKQTQMRPLPSQIPAPIKNLKWPCKSSKDRKHYKRPGRESRNSILKLAPATANLNKLSRGDSSTIRSFSIRSLTLRIKHSMGTAGSPPSRWSFTKPSMSCIRYKLLKERSHTSPDKFSSRSSSSSSRCARETPKNFWKRSCLTHSRALLSTAKTEKDRFSDTPLTASRRSSASVIATRLSCSTLRRTTMSSASRSITISAK